MVEKFIEGLLFGAGFLLGVGVMTDIIMIEPIAKLKEVRKDE